MWHISATRRVSERGSVECGRVLLLLFLAFRVHALCFPLCRLTLLSRSLYLLLLSLSLALPLSLTPTISGFLAEALLRYLFV